MREIIRLIQDIRGCLAGTAGSPPPEALAPQYVRWREEASKRLEACAAMLEKSSEYQALQLAESDPPLMDLVAQLAFAEEPRWIDYCQEHGLPVPGRLDSRSIQALNAIYSKGISSNSELYRDYRSAITSRDDDKALRIMRSIVRLNPSDSNAKTELDRLQNKKMLARLEDLKVAVARDDREAVTTLVDEIESLGTEEKLSRNEYYIEGRIVRREFLKKSAAHEATLLLEQAEAQKGQGDWRVVSGNLARIRQLEKEHDLNLPPDRQSSIAALESFVEKERKDSAMQQDFEKALAALKAFAETVDTRLLTASTLPLDEAEKLEATFATFWKRVERFQRPVPEGELARLEGIGTAIRREASRKRGSKKRVKVILAAIGIAVLCAAGWTGYVAWRAYDYVGQIKDLKSRGQAAAVARLVEEIPSAAPWGAASIPALGAAVNEARQWAKGEHDHLAITERQLDDLEKEAAGNFATLQPADFQKRLNEAKTNVGKLASDLARAPKDRLSELENKTDQHFALVKSDMVKIARLYLSTLEGLVKKLDFAKPSSEMAQILASIARTTEELDTLRKADPPDLRPTADLDASAQKLENQAAVFSKAMTEIGRAKQSMSGATTAAAYKAALKSLSEVHFAETSAAIPVLADFPTEDSIGAKLFFNGQLESWAAAKKDAHDGCKFHPDDVARSELRKILALRDDPEIISAKGERGKELQAALRLSSITDASGEHYEGSLLERMDSVVRFDEGDPIIRAYVAGNLYVVMKERPPQWGLQYCPRLVQDMSELGTALSARTLRSGDWGDKAIREKLVPRLKPLFERLAKEKRYLDEANAYYHLVSKVIDGGITYAGYVDGDHALHLKQGAEPSAQLWGQAEESSNPVAVAPGRAAGQAELAKVKKWSPLFQIAVNLQLTPLKH